MPSRLHGLFASVALLVALFGLSACQDDLTPEQIAVAKSLTIDALAPAPDDPSNAYDTNGEAAALGAALFADAGFSANGEVACATCHLADRQFQDDLPLGRGVGETDRRTMPLAGVAWSPFLFWDGRKDSLWSQALGPLESAVEHATTRTAFARRIASQHGEPYRAVFGPLPDLTGAPASAGPFGTPAEIAAWENLDAAARDAINRVFANGGKAIAAFERTLTPAQTRFDQYVRAVAEGQKPADADRFTPQETEGLKLFIGRGQCINCHNGPRLTDEHFHNTGVPAAAGRKPDPGRAAALAMLDGDEFNCLGPYSDAAPEQCAELRFMSRDEHAFEGAFKPPTLRGVAARPPYMHAGQIETLEAAIDHYSAAPAAPQGHSELQRLDLTANDKAALLAFLRTLTP
ncbi:MAG TPA: cytochrome c peroxidase [Rhizobiaceae bacterium]|nr:cytochrome c peroxidase [Rhizobiaceae bacterium]